MRSPGVGRRWLLAALLLALGLAAGCVGTFDDGGEPDPAASDAQTGEWPRCEHPWPCADGSEWPAELAPTEHPRQPPTMPDGLAIADGEVAARGPESVTYRFAGTFEGPTVAGVDATDEVRSTTFEVPAGVYLDLDGNLTWSGEDPAPPSRDASLSVQVLDAEGDTVCRGVTGIGIRVVGYVPADDRVPCRKAGVQPLEKTSEWTLEVRSHHDVDAVDEFEVTLELAVTEPVRTFPMGEPEHVRVDSFDGTTLDGYVYRPEVPEGTQVPVVLWSMPYFGQTSDFADDPDQRTGRAVPIKLLVEHGYAVATFNVRGTGLSEGCFGMFGPDEQRDQAELVRWLGDRDWSNGRVAMMGLSYHGTTPWEAAIQAPDALKTIVVAGMVSDLYTFYHTPQGAAISLGPPFQTYFNGLVTFAPPAVGVATGGPPERATTQWAPLAPDRICPEVLETMTSLWKGTATDDRNPSYWEERRLIDGFPYVSAAVLLTHGFEDRWGSGHQQQELPAWKALPESTPKHQLEGQWNHEFPDENTYEPAWAMDDWDQRLLDWLSFWLKGQGQPPDALGTVAYQDGEGRWHDSTQWPPEEADREALHLAGEELAPEPTDASRSFRSVPDHVGPRMARQSAEEGYPGPLCTRQTPAGEPPRGLLYTSDRLEADATIAGNPFAYLTIGSDQPGGLLTVTLLDLGPDFACEGPTPVDVRALTTGAADLRFHDGNLQGEDFPVDEPTQVRVDLTNLAEVVPEGHRLGALLSYGDPVLRTSQPYTPQITVHGDSELVLPVTEGSLGGAAADGDYPPRPFVPGSG